MPLGALIRLPAIRLPQWSGGLLDKVSGSAVEQCRFIFIAAKVGQDGTLGLSLCPPHAQPHPTTPCSLVIRHLLAKAPARERFRSSELVIPSDLALRHLLPKAFGVRHSPDPTSLAFRWLRRIF
ncbi:hypothetical protein SBV1_1330035 [Verrucomicrobia bacterium]|nr:hypothetical protein SBV1_1330035 [Verrucomicrobiota bacterium]